MQPDFKAKYIFRGLLFAVLFVVTGVYLGSAIPWGIDFLEGFYYCVIAGAFIALVVYTLWECDERTQSDYQQLLNGKFLPVKFPGRIIAFLVLVVVLHKLFIWGFQAKDVYNKSVVYNKHYERATQGLQGFYDGMYKTWIAKEKIAVVSKETFIELAKIAFEARKDGANLGWKWVSENTPIPYNEFAAFYKDLSAFVELKREQYFELEVQRQNIANQHNMMLDTFPNNIYNKILGRKHIKYEYGFLSDSTRKVFDTGNENVE